LRHLGLRKGQAADTKIVRARLRTWKLAPQPSQN
jgi:hypothetical protein